MKGGQFRLPLENIHLLKPAALLFSQRAIEIHILRLPLKEARSDRFD
jgi:hypothetical protein